MQDIAGAQILKVEGKPTRNNNLRYVIGVFAPGVGGIEPSTFDASLAMKAQQFIGQTCDVRIEQDGKYLNFKDIAPSGGLQPLAVPAGTPIGTLGGAPAMGQIPIVQGNGGGGFDATRDRKIVAQSSLSTAFEFVGALYTGAGPEALGEAVTVAKNLGKELFDLVYAVGNVEPTQMSPAQQFTPPPVLPAAGTPVDVAAQVNEVMGGEVQVGPPASAPATGPSWS